MEEEGLGPEFRELVRRRQSIRARAIDAGLSETDLEALDMLAWYKLQNSASEDQRFDVLDFLEKTVADYINRALLPQPVPLAEPLK
jgi:hypothetical protein